MEVSRFFRKMSGACWLQQIVNNILNLEAFVREQFADIIAIPGQDV